MSAVTGAFGTMWKEAQVAHWQIVQINFVRLAQVIADPTAENVFNLVKNKAKRFANHTADQCYQCRLAFVFISARSDKCSNRPK